MNKIIYIDDDSDDRDFFEDIVEHMDRKVMLISSGPNFFDTIYDDILKDAIIFVDLNLPKMSGQEIILQLRRKFSPAELPIVVLSATDDDSEIESSYSCGANAFIPKCTSYANLRDFIAETLDRNWSRHIVTRENFIITSSNALLTSH